MNLRSAYETALKRAGELDRHYAINDAANKIIGKITYDEWNDICSPLTPVECDALTAALLSKIQLHMMRYIHKREDLNLDKILGEAQGAKHEQ